jgi:hypothetical protein
VPTHSNAERATSDTRPSVATNESGGTAPLSYQNSRDESQATVMIATMLTMPGSKEASSKREIDRKESPGITRNIGQKRIILRKKKFKMLHLV